MKNYSFLRFFVSAAFALLIFSTAARAQFIEPDLQIKRAMTMYVRQNESALSSSRARFSAQTQAVEKIQPKLAAAAENIERESGVTFTLERRVFDLLNERRAANGLAPLRWSEDVARAARIHSDEMARYNLFSHQGFDGSMVKDRAEAAGIWDWQSIGENIAFNRGFKLPAESACVQWMESPGHRENIMDARWTNAGIGVAIAPDGAYYFTEVFITK